MFIEGDVKQIIDRPETEKHKTAGRPAERLRGKIMMNKTNAFTWTNANGTAQYTATENGRYYREENGKKVRISRAEYDTAWEASTNPTLVETEAEKDKAAEDAFNGVTEKAPGKPEKAHKDAKVQKDSKKAKDAKKAKEKAPKAKKVPEGGAEFEVGQPPYSETVILTAKQIDFIRRLPDTNFWENGLDSCVWVDCLCDEIGGQFAGKPMTVGAMISTLCEKGLGTRTKQKVNNHKATAFQLTEKGKLVAQALGLK